MVDIPGSEFRVEADLVFLAMGFLHVEHSGPVKEFGLEFDKAGNIRVDNNYMTSRDGVFSAGDSVRGASLVVWAIHQGRETAHGVHRYLME